MDAKQIFFIKAVFNMLKYMFQLRVSSAKVGQLLSEGFV